MCTHIYIPHKIVAVMIPGIQTYLKFQLFKSSYKIQASQPPSPARDMDANVTFWDMEQVTERNRLLGKVTSNQGEIKRSRLGNHWWSNILKMLPLLLSDATVDQNKTFELLMILGSQGETLGEKKTTGNFEKI